MYSLIIALIVALVAAWGSMQITESPAWQVIAGLLGFFLTTLIISRIFTHKLKQLFNAVQQRIEGAQLEVNKYITRVQTTGKGGGPKSVQRKVRRIMNAAYRESLETLDRAVSYYKWVLLAERDRKSTRLNSSHYS